MTTHKPILCSCGTQFIPMVGYSGMIQSKLCQPCRINSEIAKRKQVLYKVVSLDQIMDKTALKSKLKALKSKTATEKKPRSAERKLIEKLDREFSLFIRHRDSKNGSFVCISCHKPKPFEQADCGHYFNRQYISVRFDLVNCNAQCRKCNRFQEGNIQGYREGLVDKFGKQALNELTVRKVTTKKYTLFELEKTIEYYKQKNKDHLLSGELF